MTSATPPSPFPSRPSGPDPVEPGPDRNRIDGPAGWTVVAATFLSTFTVFGVAYSFGAFFRPMTEEFGTNRGATALVFAITTFLYFALGVVTGHLADRFGPRPVVAVGGVAMVLGLLATSRVQEIWSGYLTYGLGVGIGVACCYVPMVAAVGGWFERSRTTALGVAVAGIGVGTLTVAPLAERLIADHGWRRTYVVMAVGSGILLAVAAVGARRPPVVAAADDDAGSVLGRVLRTSRTFWVLYVSALITSLALFVPFVFLPDYVETRGIDGSAGWLIGSIGISSVVGRLGLGTLGARYGVFRLYQGSLAVLGLSFLIWLGAGSRYALLLLFTVVLGVAYGGFIALAPAVAAQTFGVKGLGAVLGALYTGAGIGGLVGPPLMGRIIDDAGYTTALVLALIAGVASSVLLFAVPERA
ncbi:MAG: MFS transporter [Acidimicrobiales bacterium]